MKITKVTYYDINNIDSTCYLSKCSVVLDDSLVLHEIKILEGRKGRYIVMPLKVKVNYIKGSSTNNSKEDVFHPVNKEFFSYISNIILKGFKIYENTGKYIYIP